MATPVRRCSRSRTRASEVASILKTAKSEQTSSIMQTEEVNDPNAFDNRLVLRSKYRAVKNLMNLKRDEIGSPDSEKFNSIFSEVERLYKQVRMPKEQVIDAKALLYITDTLSTSVKSQNSEGVTPTDFVTYLLKNFANQNRVARTGRSKVSLAWKDVGLGVCHLFRKVSGCRTMLGPMDSKMKQRKAYQRKCTKLIASESPKDLDDARANERIDTDKNMATMFGILKKERSVKLEDVVLNRNSFSQTVENLFTLSFLVKDGRAEITIDSGGCHLVSPRNAPAATAIASGNASYNHFVFRFDFRDWKLMKDSVDIGKELMPHRCQPDMLTQSQGPQSHPATTAPVRKSCRNQGLVIQEKSIVTKTPENDNPNTILSPMRMRKRKIR